MTLGTRNVVSPSKIEALSGLNKLSHALEKSAKEEHMVVDEQSMARSHSASPTDPNNKMVYMQSE